MNDNLDIDVDVTSEVDEDDNSIRVIVTLSGFNDDTDDYCDKYWLADHLEDYITEKIKELDE